MSATPLLPLSGSPKQLRWAEDIRASVLPALVDHLSAALGLTPLSRQSAAVFLEEAVRQLCNRQPTYAAWWIEARHQIVARLQTDLDRHTPRLAAAYRAALLASIRTQAVALDRVVRPDLERLSLEALTYEEAILARLAGIREQGQALDAARSSRRGQPKATP